MKNTNSKEENKAALKGKSRAIKLGIDVHADFYVVVRQKDEAMPQPAQKFTPAKFKEWARTQLGEAEEVHSCYEAGPFGYGLHRELLAMGVHNVVIRPQDWDGYGKGVKTDKTDALAMVQQLDRYVRGNRQALAVVHPPGVEQELLRSESRQREQFRRNRQQMEAQGRTLMLYYGYRTKGRWWQPARWKELAPKLPAPILKMVSLFRETILRLHEVVEQLTQTMEKANQGPKIKGYGALTSQVVEREIGDWNRFENRRQVASLTGLCPGVRASGQSHRQGSITRHGNPRLRKALIELVWRIVRYQPEYFQVKKWQPELTGRNPAAKKKAVVAIARHLVIDLWRIQTKRIAPEQVGLSLLA
jgi:transposase